MNPGTPAVQQTSDNQPVSSVVPFPAEDGYRLAAYRSIALFQMSDNALACALHQDGAWDVRFRDRAAIECLHLGSCHDLHRWPCARDRYRMMN